MDSMKNGNDPKPENETIRIEKIQKKEEEPSYEAGSGAMYIPILGDLFPKLWGQKMNPGSRYRLLINGCSYSVEKELFDKVKEDDSVEMHFSKNGKNLLYIK